MTTQDNVTLTRMVYDLYNAHQSDPAWLDKSLASIAEDCEVFLVPLGMTLHGHDGYKQFLLGWAEAFDIPATGRKVEFRLCNVHRIKNGKFVSLHQYYDALGFMQQLGLIPSQG